MAVLEKEFFVEQFSKLRNEMSEFRDEVNQRFDRVDERLDRHDEKLEAIEKSLRQQHHATGELYTMVTDLQRRMELVEQRTGIDTPEH